MIASLLSSVAAELEPPRAATLTDALGRKPTIDEVATALFEAVRTLEDPAASFLDESDTREDTARYLAEYENELWTWRR
jgi:lipoate-protein ligase A